MRLSPLIPLASASLLLVACQATPPPATPPVSLSFDWGSTRACFETASPNFTVGNVPPGTVKLGFRMTDLNLPQFNHGGGVIAYSGQSTIPMGAFSYKGPCPQLKAHTYRWTVDAVDGQGDVLASGQAEQPFPQGVAVAPVPAAPPPTVPAPK